MQLLEQQPSMFCQRCKSKVVPQNLKVMRELSRFVPYQRKDLGQDKRIQL